MSVSCPNGEHLGIIPNACGFPLCPVGGISLGNKPSRACSYPQEPTVPGTSSSRSIRQAEAGLRGGGADPTGGAGEKAQPGDPKRRWAGAEAGGQTPRSVGRPGKQRNLKEKAGKENKQDRGHLRSVWAQGLQATGGKTRGDADGTEAATADTWEGGGGGHRGRGHTTRSKRVDSLGPGDWVKVGERLRDRETERDTERIREREADTERMTDREVQAMEQDGTLGGQKRRGWLWRGAQDRVQGRKEREQSSGRAHAARSKGRRATWVWRPSRGMGGNARAGLTRVTAGLGGWSSQGVTLMIKTSRAGRGHPAASVAARSKGKRLPLPRPGPRDSSRWRFTLQTTCLDHQALCLALGSVPGCTVSPQICMLRS